MAHLLFMRPVFIGGVVNWHEGFSQQAIAEVAVAYMFFLTCSCVWYGSHLFLIGTAVVNISLSFKLSKSP